MKSRAFLFPFLALREPQVRERGATIRIVVLALGALALAGCSPVKEASRAVAVQHEGQVKSFESFARQTMDVVVEKETLNGKPAHEVVWRVLASPDVAAAEPWIRVRHKELADTLGLEHREKDLYSYAELSPLMPKLEALVRSARAKRDRDEKTSPLEQKAEALDYSLYVVKNLLTREALKVFPGEGDRAHWLIPGEGAGEALDKEFALLLADAREGRHADFERRAAEWNRAVSAKTGGRYDAKISRELLYFAMKPFQRAWLLYLVAALVLASRFKRKRLAAFGVALAGLAFAFHTTGMTLRVLILDRPPVSNMYESMFFMDWVVIVSAAAFAVVRRNLTPLSVASFVSAVILIYGDLLPIDTGLDVLVPVLRSNYWLTIHVLTIVSSYGVFALAMGLGHRQLWLGLRGKLSKPEEERSAQAIYRVMQVGLLLLGIGTVLGGVWANESWGRFWGWDPKETWALITFLGYLVIVHLKLTKVLDAFGMAVGSILGFFFVLMTWYGVNFVLGRGLHSYGFSSGGMAWIAYYLVLEVLFLAAVLYHRFSPRR